MSEQYKYEAVFGDQSLFDGAEPDVFLVETNGVYKTFHKETSGKVTIWTRNGCDLAMRRIIRTPTWTVEDQKAGRLPEVGSKAVSVHGFCVVDILAVRNGCVVACNSDISDARPCVFTIDNFLELYTPIESPEEKAARLREEWCNEAGLVCSLGMTTLTRIYDALLSGELKTPESTE